VIINPVLNMSVTSWAVDLRRKMNLCFQKKFRDCIKGVVTLWNVNVSVDMICGCVKCVCCKFVGLKCVCCKFVGFKCVCCKFVGLKCECRQIDSKYSFNTHISGAVSTHTFQMQFQHTHFKCSFNTHTHTIQFQHTHFRCSFNTHIPGAVSTHTFQELQSNPIKVTSDVTNKHNSKLLRIY